MVMLLQDYRAHLEAESLQHKHRPLLFMGLICPYLLEHKMKKSINGTV